jgi:hypothetical protein
MNYVGFEVLTAVVIKSSIFWDIKPYSPLIAEQVTNRSSTFYLLHAGFSLGLFFDPEESSDTFLRNVG